MPCQTRTVVTISCALVRGSASSKRGCPDNDFSTGKNSTTCSSHKGLGFHDSRSRRWEIYSLQLEQCVRISSFEEQFSTVNEKIADILQEQEDWKGAVELLLRIPLTSSQCNISEEYKSKMLVRITMLYLEDDDEVNTEIYVGRSLVIIGKSEFKNLELKFHHQACLARIYDAKCKIMGEQAVGQTNWTKPWTYCTRTSAQRKLQHLI